ncbi:hypothetical protein Pla100_35260 [Neorhodopirellula pilleata]|uniref:Uncharacterized protein n=1 Tax=Neorhodopirellula pilleata TaxID=2714738 RepID=A0A5C6A6F4_9BACT|nr:hypothetical protein Pla100_35260 [Neorhodopirellula pilleata]
MSWQSVVSPGSSRGDTFYIVSDPEKLGRQRVPGQPNGYFTWLEFQYLKKKGIQVIELLD